MTLKMESYYKRLEVEIQAIKLMLIEDKKGVLIIGDWISLKNLKRFFDYSDSQIKRLIKNENLIYTRIGNRKFISVKSILSLLNRKI